MLLHSMQTPVTNAALRMHQQPASAWSRSHSRARALCPAVAAPSRLLAHLFTERRQRRQQQQRRQLQQQQRQQQGSLLQDPQHCHCEATEDLNALPAGSGLPASLPPFTSGSVTPGSRRLLLGRAHIASLHAAGACTPLYDTPITPAATPVAPTAEGSDSISESGAPAAAAAAADSSATSRQLTARLTRSQTWQALRHVLAGAPSGSLNTIHASAALSRLVRLAPEGSLIRYEPRFAEFLYDLEGVVGDVLASVVGAAVVEASGTRKAGGGSHESSAVGQLQRLTRQQGGGQHRQQGRRQQQQRPQHPAPEPQQLATLAWVRISKKLNRWCTAMRSVYHAARWCTALHPETFKFSNAMAARHLCDMPAD